jgi:hypothetical protein
MTVAIARTGDWALARRLLARGPGKLKDALGVAVRQEAQLLRKHIVEGLTRQAPGGQPIAPLAATTLAARRLKRFRGTKALLRRGDLRGAIAVVTDGAEAFVGVLRKARGRGGAPLVNVARAQEFGAGPIVVPITPKMRRFLFLLLRRAGIRPNGDAGGRGVVTIRIPARPFLRPAFEVFKRGAQKRFLRRVAELAGFAA